MTPKQARKIVGFLPRQSQILALSSTQLDRFMSIKGSSPYEESSHHLSNLVNGEDKPRFSGAAHMDSIELMILGESVD